MPDDNKGLRAAGFIQPGYVFYVWSAFVIDAEFLKFYVAFQFKPPKTHFFKIPNLVLSSKLSQVSYQHRSLYKLISQKLDID